MVPQLAYIIPVLRSTIIINATLLLSLCLPLRESWVHRYTAKSQACYEFLIQMMVKGPSLVSRSSSNPVSFIRGPYDSNPSPPRLLSIRRRPLRRRVRRSRIALRPPVVRRHVLRRVDLGDPLGRTRVHRRPAGVIRRQRHIVHRVSRLIIPALLRLLVAVDSIRLSIRPMLIDGGPVGATTNQAPMVSERSQSFPEPPLGMEIPHEHIKRDGAEDGEE